jgi:hypothetical protein
MILLKGLLQKLIKMSVHKLIHATLFLLFLSGCASELVRPQLESSNYRLKRLAVVPFRTTIGSVGVGSKTLLSTKEENIFRNSLYEAIRSAVSPKMEALILDSSATDPTKISITPESLFELGLERQKLALDIQAPYKNEFRYQCSERVAEIAQELGVDSFLFLDFEAIKRTRLQYALALIRSTLTAISSGNIFTKFPGRKFVTGNVEIIDASSGDLLYFNEIAIKASDFEDEEEVKELVKTLLMPFTSKLGLENNMYDLMNDSIPSVPTFFQKIVSFRYVPSPQ